MLAEIDSWGWSSACAVSLAAAAQPRGYSSLEKNNPLAQPELPRCRRADYPLLSRAFCRGARCSLRNGVPVGQGNGVQDMSYDALPQRDRRRGRRGPSNSAADADAARGRQAPTSSTIEAVDRAVDARRAQLGSSMSQAPSLVELESAVVQRQADIAAAAAGARGGGDAAGGALTGGYEPGGGGGGEVRLGACAGDDAERGGSIERRKSREGVERWPRGGRENASARDSRRGFVL